MRRIEPGDLDVRCPTCNAGPGMFCHSTHGNQPFKMIVHRERRIETLVNGKQREESGDGV